MSLEAMVWALKRAPVPDSEPIAHLVLIGLADHASSEGTGAYPSVRTLAEYARCSARTVHNKLRVLEEAGLIRRGDQQMVAHLRGDRRPVVWELAVEHLFDGVNDVHTVEPVDNSDHAMNAGSPRDGHGVNDTDPRGERGDTHGVNRCADKPSFKPSINQGGNPTPHQPVDNTLQRPDRCARHQTVEYVSSPCIPCRDARVKHELHIAEIAEAAKKEKDRLEQTRCPAHPQYPAYRCRICASEHKAGEHIYHPEAHCHLCQEVLVS